MQVSPGSIFFASPNEGHVGVKPCFDEIGFLNCTLGLDWKYHLNTPCILCTTCQSPFQDPQLELHTAVLVLVRPHLSKLNESWSEYFRHCIDVSNFMNL